MIRREFTSSDGTRMWLLISQVEHAHVSGELVRNWQEDVTRDVIDAITHHDDGWAAWEAEPKLNPKLGAPYSFLEMPVPAALVIWDHSIAAAGAFGPLAACIVAGHFYQLLGGSENANDPLANAWLTAKRKWRTTWLDEWVRADPAHTLEYAKRAQDMLLLSDLFSLWLCCDCPVDAQGESILGQSAMKLRTDTLLAQFQFAVPEFTIRGPSSNSGTERLDWTVAVEPFPFKKSPLSLSAVSVAAPVSRYADWAALKAASRSVELRWRLVPAAQPVGSAP